LQERSKSRIEDGFAGLQSTEKDTRFDCWDRDLSAGCVVRRMDRIGPGSEHREQPRTADSGSAVLASDGSAETCMSHFPVRWPAGLRGDSKSSENSAGDSLLLQPLLVPASVGVLQVSCRRASKGGLGGRHEVLGVHTCRKPLIRGVTVLASGSAAGKL